jgi:hypothetical protein
VVYITLKPLRKALNMPNSATTVLPVPVGAATMTLSSLARWTMASSWKGSSWKG